MPLPVIPVWKKAPFIRLLVPLITGILIQWHLQIKPQFFFIFLSVSVFILTLYFFIPFFERFKRSAINGLAVFILFISIGGLLSWHKNIRHDKSWFGYHYSGNECLVVTLLENPVEKTKSFKANASVDCQLRNDSFFKTSGNIIVYFKKDSSVPVLEYGSRLIIKKSLQEIKNSGNPGGFDYKRYSLFQGITHQVYLKENEFEILTEKNKNRVKDFLANIRRKVLNILHKNITGDKELGLAEALLIGYKDDLDKTLVQSYSNTGVVHVIAISGLHLGLIYWLLQLIFRPLQKRKNLKWTRVLLILSGLWLFSLLAGAQPSVIRSAVMFSCIVLGDSFKRKSSIYNTLAFSAFILLCYNPFWLWDVGFQLSYAAVLSIVIFMKPVYNWIYFPNKILDFLWKLTAVTIAAQVFTVPVSIYHFHQFPNYFLFTNFVAVPLSSLILLGEILLCLLSVFPMVAFTFGKLLSWLIWILNSYIEKIEKIPFSLWDQLQINIPQTVLLIIFAGGTGFWLMEKQKKGLKLALISLVAFFILRSISFINATRQENIIVYNVPQKQAIDFISGRKYIFTGDPDLLADDFIRNFHLKPSRTLHRVNPDSAPANFKIRNSVFHFRDKKILLIDSAYPLKPGFDESEVDLLIISKNPKLYITNLTKYIKPKQIVFDGSTPAWKINYWKKDCDSLHIPYHDVSEKGAFVMKVR